MENGQLKTYEEPIDIKINIYGKLDEVKFLERLYDLDNLPSSDSRFKDFRGDIYQHRYNNYDWDDNWIFDDERLHLRSGNDEYLLNYLCDLFHPYVRDEKSNWKYFFDEINELLRIDGYELYEKSKISNRSVYAWKLVESIEVETSVNSNYELKLIGSGSYANVYSFHDDFYNKKFVLKRAKKDLNDKEIERFRREFAELKKLNSPYVIEVYNFNKQKNEYIMEFMDYTLFDFINSTNNNLEFKKRINLVNQLLRAFNYLITREVLHRDISYTNILLKCYDDVIILKISDFGLVKLKNSDLTSLNTEFKGSLNDPRLEICGFENYNVQHEIYALTRVIYFIMTGKRTVDNRSDNKLLEFVRKGTNSDLNIRYKSINEMQTEFMKIFSKSIKND